MTDKTILLVFTGGTIGSVAKAGTIAPDAAATPVLLELLRREYRDADTFSFQVIRPLNLLSENFTPHVWEQLCQAIAAANPASFDGIIVTHGTDTLSYSAAALSFCFHDLATPILLVSSDYPLHDSRANGLANFICALEFIRQIPQPGVFVPYRNAGQTLRVHQGNHLASSWQLSGDFYSVQNRNPWEFQDQFLETSPRAAKTQTWPNPLAAQFSSQILLVRPHPGLDYRAVNLDYTQAVLHDLYHSGTACAAPPETEHLALPFLLRRCQAQQIPIYLAPALAKPDCYQSTRSLMDLGAQMLWNLSLEAAYVKLSLAYGLFNRADEIAAFLEADIAGEHVNF